MTPLRRLPSLSYVTGRATPRTAFASYDDGEPRSNAITIGTSQVNYRSRSNDGRAFVKSLIRTKMSEAAADRLSAVSNRERSQQQYELVVNCKNTSSY
jgi:hypothetical protein